MKVAILTIGTVGDLFPCVSIARSLERMQHGVRLIAAPRLAAMARMYGLQTLADPLGDLSPSNVSGYFSAGRHGLQGLLSSMRNVVIPEVAPSARRLIPKLSDVDCIVAHPLYLAAPLIADALQVPLVALSWNLWWHLDLPLVAPELQKEHKRSFEWYLAECALALREAGGTGSLDPADIAAWPERLAARSLPLVESAIAGPAAEGIGLPRFTPPLADTEPIKAFRAAPGPRVVVTLGSVRLPNREVVRQRILDGCGQLAASVFVTGEPPSLERTASGHGVMTAKLPPLKELAASADLVVHHGGIGTSCEVAAAGVPALILPCCNDGFLNAEALARTGAARVLPWQQAGVGAVDWLTEAIGSVSCRTAAQALAGKISAAGVAARRAAEAIVGTAAAGHG